MRIRRSVPQQTGNILEKVNRKTEILAPVGGEEQLRAAVRCGADAVYFGMGNFNARRNAENFADEGLKDTIRYCHQSGVKVYITINTIIKDSELSEAFKAVDTAALAGADAVIIQDFAIASYVRKFWPDLKMHASTQMAVHNSEGVQRLVEYGFSRVVLARELSLEEIRAIYEKTHAELEVFIHGAHCMSVSGNCYVSAMIGGRSGNRGLCAQPCRLDWDLDGADHALSLKDMSYMDSLKELSEIGIASFKIEGRMKRPEYVAAAVTSAGKALSGESYDAESLRAVFSRSGFTDGYLKGKRDADMFGFRTKDDVTAAPAVLKEFEKLYEKEPQHIPVDMLLYVQKGEPSQLSVSCGDYSVVVMGDEPEKAINLPIDEAYARRSLEKTGGTPYYLSGFTLAADEGLMLSSSKLNALRRDALDKLTDERTAFDRKKSAGEFEQIKQRSPKRKFRRYRFESADQIFDGAEKSEAIILPLPEIEKHMRLIDKYRLWAEIPDLIYEGSIEDMMRRLRDIKAAGVYDVVCGNIGSVRLAKELGFTVHGGFCLNVFNSRALAEYEDMGLADMCLSFEMSFADMKKLKSRLPFGYVSYGYLPLMKFRACPGKCSGGCGSCRGERVLTDRIGEKFTMLCRNGQYSELLNCVPLYTADKQTPASDFELLYFTTETRDECEEISLLSKEGLEPDFRKTSGLYFRNLI